MRNTKAPRKPRLSRGAKLIGYARVSTQAQDLTRQLQALKRERCDVIYSDKASGRALEGRPQLDAALAVLAPDDCLVVAEWDRATRSMWDGLQIVKQVIEAGATIRILDFPSLDLTTPEGRGFLAMFSAIAERERTRIIARTHEGRQLARKRGVKMGRTPKLKPEQQQRIAQRLEAGESSRSIARDFAVSHATINRLR